MTTSKIVTGALIKDIAALKQKKFRDETGRILVEARHPIEEAFRAGLKLQHLLVQAGAPASSLPQIPAAAMFIEVDEAAMARMATTSSPPPCLAVFDTPRPVTQVQGDLALVLDSIQDPGNLGTLIRSAVAFGFETVILAGETVEAWNPKVIRASAGLVFAVPLLPLVETDRLVSLLPPAEWTVWATTAQAEVVSYKKADFSGRCAIVLGNEGRGVSPGLLSGAAKALTIPMMEPVESLNVAVSGSIIMAEAAAFRKQALQKQK